MLRSCLEYMIIIGNESDGEVEDAVLLVGLHEVVDEVSVEQGLDDAGDKGSPHHMLPLENPN